jgi:hypothetical protein
VLIAAQVGDDTGQRLGQLTDFVLRGRLEFDLQVAGVHDPGAADQFVDGFDKPVGDPDGAEGEDDFEQHGEMSSRFCSV